LSLSRRSLNSFDWLWFLALLALAGAGLVTIWSSTEGTGLNSYFGRQAIYLAFALALYLGLLYLDYHFFADRITFLYLAGLVLLAAVLLIGRTVHNTKGWIALGMLSFQPSEMVKLLVIVALAKYYSEIEREHLTLSELIKGGLIVLVPMLLVVLQGDLGTAVTFVPIFVGISFIAGLRRKHVLVVVVIALACSPLGWMKLKDYQKGRIQTVFNPSNDPHHLGYQTIQSKIAIGSGKFLGKGFKQGSQGQLGFLPARHTDFVFAVVSEERGFLGSISVLGLFLFVSIRLLRTAREAKDKIGALIVVGVLALFLFHVMINVGMVIGLLPITGIPLPLLSAGGSSLISTFLAMSLCMNIRMRRYVN
jgi:rod shape determining protein RodA